MNVFDSIIVGAGPAGMTASLQLARMGFNIRIFERYEPGGLLLHANCIENFPGIEGSISGVNLAEKFISKLRSFGVFPQRAEVTDWVKDGGNFVVFTNDGERYLTRTLIIATGTKPKESVLRCEGDIEMSWRKTSNFLNFRSIKPSCVMILGGGDAAFDYAISLASSGWKVKILFRREHPRALKILVERALMFSQISIEPSFLPEFVRLSTCGVELWGNRYGEKCVFYADFLLEATGRIPEDKLLKGLNPPSSLDGRVEGVEGLFIAGDLRRMRSRQAVISAGDGMASAMAAGEYILQKRK